MSAPTSVVRYATPTITPARSANTSLQGRSSELDTKSAAARQSAKVSIGSGTQNVASSTLSGISAYRSPAGQPDLAAPGSARQPGDQRRRENGADEWDQRDRHVARADREEDGHERQHHAEPRVVIVRREQRRGAGAAKQGHRDVGVVEVVRRPQPLAEPHRHDERRDRGHEKRRRPTVARRGTDRSS